MQKGISRAGLAFASLAGVAIAGLVAMAGVETGTARLPASGQVQEARAGGSAATAVNGSRPMTVPVTLRLDGIVDGLAPGTAPTRVTVVSGSSRFNANINGNAYSVRVGGLEDARMLAVEVEAPGVRYSSQLGSFLELKIHSGGDRRVTSSEHSSLRVSPISTAMAWMARRGLGGRDPANPAEWRRALRELDGATLINIAYVLHAFAAGDIPSGAAHADGLALVEDSDAYRQVLDQPMLEQDALDWASHVSDGVALGSLAALPQNLALLAAASQDEPSTGQDAVVIERLTDGTYRISEADFEGRSDTFPGAAGVIDGSGRLVFTPESVLTVNLTLPARFLGGGRATAESSLQSLELRRLTPDARDGGGLWLLTERWSNRFLYTPEHVEPRSVVRLLSGFDLDREAGTPAWARGHEVRALPWFCREPGFFPDDPPILKACEYAQHQFLASDAGVVLRLGRKVHPDLTPKADGPGPSFSWRETVGGRLRVEFPETSVDFWLLDPPGSTYGRVLYLARDTEGDRLAGITVALQDDGITLGLDEIIGSWLTNYSVARIDRYPTPDGYFFLDRNADGTGTQRSLGGGLPDDITPITWTYEGGVVRDMRRIAMYADGSSAKVPDCEVAIANGATDCFNDRLRYFKPMKRLARGRVAGIEHIYFNPAAVGEVSEVAIVSASRPNIYDCDAGACVEASSAPARAMPADAPAVLAGVARRGGGEPRQPDATDAPTSAPAVWRAVPAARSALAVEPALGLAHVVAAGTMAVPAPVPAERTTAGPKGLHPLALGVGQHSLPVRLGFEWSAGPGARD